MTNDNRIRLEKHEASMTHEFYPPAGHLYYFEVGGRAKPPYIYQREVVAILDIARDGTLAGVELIDDMPPPPFPFPKATD